MRLGRGLLVALVAVAPAPALAALSDQAFRDGRWAEVTAAGRAERTAAGLLLSARALLIRAAYEARSREEALALINEAERDVEAALASSASDRTALLQRSAIIGYRARLARSPQGGRESREMLRALNRGHADWPDGWTALAVWHGESVAAVGPFVARTVLGANRGAMERDFDEAARLDPRSPSIPALRGLLLLRLSAEADSGLEARQWLARATALRPRDGYEALLRGHAAEVLALLDRGDTQAARARAARLAAFGRFDG